MSQYGSVRIKLGDLLSNAGLSKNKFSHLAQLERTQLNRYVNNQVSRLDTDVIARICHSLDCKIDDLLEYIPPEDNVKNK